MTIRPIALMLVLVASVLGCFRASSEKIDIEKNGAQYGRHNKERIVELGLVDVAQSHKCNLTLQNVSDKVVKILGSHASCGCVRFFADSNVIEPNSFCEAHCLITPSSPGPISQSLRVVTDSETSSSMYFQFHGIAKGIWTDAHVIDYGTTGVQLSQSRRLIVFIAGYPQSQIDSMNISETRFSVKKQLISPEKAIEMNEDPFGLREGIIAGAIQAWQVELSWSADEGESGRLSTLLSVVSRSGGVVEIPVYYTVSHTHFMPTTLVFAGVKVGTEEVRESLCTLGASASHFALEEIDLTTGNSNVKGEIILRDGKVFLQCRVLAESPPLERVIQGHVSGSVSGTEVFRLPYIVSFRH